MSLPHPNIVFTPLTIITAQAHNEQMANVRSLADGTGFDYGAVGSSAIGDNTILPRHLTAESRGDYTLDEVDTGQKWIDGKNIYRKTVYYGSLPNNQLKQVAHGISGIARVVHVVPHATDNSTSGTWINIPYFNPGTATMGSFRVTDSAIFVQSSIDRSSIVMHVTIFYTKS